jgi:hypothetical protein
MRLLIIFLLAAGPAIGQSLPPVMPPLGTSKPLFSQPFSQSFSERLCTPGFFPENPPAAEFSQPANDPIRVLRPDNMPCKILSLARVEPMPIRLLPNGRYVDRMPNGITSLQHE